MNETSNTNEKWLSIDQVCAETGLSRCWVHRMVVQGKLPAAATRKVHRVSPVYGDETKIERWEINVADPVVATKLGGGGHNKRDDGRSRMILHATKEELDAAAAVLAAAGLPALLVSRQQSKRKPRR
jgi:hypothetical protein